MLLLRGEPVALEAYIGWLYSAGHLDIRTSFGESDYEFTVNVFRALILAIGMADPRYKRAVLEAFIDKRPAVTQEVISWIYDSSNVSALIPGGEVYNFLVDYTMTRYTNERDRFKTLLRSGACPERFVAHCKFFISCRHGRNIRWLSEVDLLRKYTRLYLPGLPIPVARADWEEVRYWHDVCELTHKVFETAELTFYSTPDYPRRALLLFHVSRSPSLQTQLPLVRLF